jgi:hypothetical protein
VEDYVTVLEGIPLAAAERWHHVTHC